jgi:thiosulfate/3-mercaptopyruvate sulfurtransferase
MIIAAFRCIAGAVRCNSQVAAAVGADHPRMRKTLIALLLLFALPALAASPRDSMIVNASWLRAHLGDANLVLLHVGDKAEYDAKHIPGAVFASLKNISVSDHTGKGLMLEMPPAEELKKDFEAFGISDASRVVVYYGKDWISPATRIIFTLDYAGLGGRASLLDGGMPAWIEAGGETTNVVPAVKKGSLSPLKFKPLVVDADYVKGHLNTSGVAIVDGRDAIFYDGAKTGGSHAGEHRTGHIAGAHSFPFTQLVDDKNFVRSSDDLAALFAKAGVKPNDTVVGYCHIGQQATAMLFAARSLGHPVLLYDGSFEDWSRHDGYPVENPSEKK